MMNFLARAGFATLLAMGTLAGTIVPASAQVGVDVYVDNPRHRPPPPPPPGYHRPPPPPYYGRPPRGCDPRMAENIARDYGLRRTRVVDISPRVVTVEGFGRRGPDRIFFGNVRGCPVMRR